MVDASKVNESYLSAGKYLTEGYVKGITCNESDTSKIIEPYILAFYRSMGLPISILEDAYTTLSSGFDLKIYPNGRVEHLSKYGKKYRTRKKNNNRAIKFL